MILNNFQRIKCSLSNMFRTQFKGFCLDNHETIYNPEEVKRKRKVHKISSNSDTKCLVIHPIFPEKYINIKSVLVLILNRT